MTSRMKSWLKYCTSYVHWSGNLFGGQSKVLSRFYFLPLCLRNATSQPIPLWPVGLSQQPISLPLPVTERCRSCPSCTIQWAVYRSWLKALRKGEKEESWSWCYFWSKISSDQDEQSPNLESGDQGNWVRAPRPHVESCICQTCRQLSLVYLILYHLPDETYS